MLSGLLLGPQLWEQPLETLGEEVESDNTPCIYSSQLYYTSPHYIFHLFFSLTSVAATSSLCVSPKVEQCVYLVSPRKLYHFFEFHFFDFP